MVRSRSTVEVRSWYGRGTVEVRSRFGRGTVEVRSRCVIQCSVVVVRSRYSPGTLPVHSWYGILKVRILDAPRTWYTYCSFYCSNRAIAA